MELDPTHLVEAILDAAGHRSGVNGFDDFAYVLSRGGGLAHNAVAGCFYAVLRSPLLALDSTTPPRPTVVVVTPSAGREVLRAGEVAEFYIQKLPDGSLETRKSYQQWAMVSNLSDARVPIGFSCEFEPMCVLDGGNDDKLTCYGVGKLPGGEFAYHIGADGAGTLHQHVAGQGTPWVVGTFEGKDMADLAPILTDLGQGEPLTGIKDFPRRQLARLYSAR